MRVCSPKAYGYSRDKLIYEAILKHKILSQEQIELLFFQVDANGKKLKKESAKRQSQLRLKILVNKNLIHRWRTEINETYNYYVTDISQKEHIVLINWMLIWYLYTHKYEKIYYIDYQTNLKYIIPDLFLITYNQCNKQQPYKGIFFEMDKTTSNPMDKIYKYNSYYKKGNYNLQWWAKLISPKFPEIYIATTSKYRLKEIKNKIELDNINKLKFKSYLIDQLKGEIKNAKEDNSNFNNILLPNSTYTSSR